jgi:hypothetical protein
MLRRLAVLAVAVLATPGHADARELPVPIAELASAPFAGALPAAPEAAVVSPALAAGPLLARLVWLDPTGVARGTEAVVRSEVTRLLRAVGVSTAWRRGEPHEVAREGELRVIFLDRGAPRGHGAPVLGATPASFQGERFVWVHVPSVRAAAGVAGRASGPNLEVRAARELGLGLGRVIVHEVVHALAPSVPHGRGLMAARLDRSMLTTASVRLDPEVGLAVRSALEGRVSPPAAATDLLAAESAREERHR